MHDACREGQIAIFMAILKARCNLNIPNKVGIFMNILYPY